LASVGILCLVHARPVNEEVVFKFDDSQSNVRR
jgi:hypothetical protein